MNGTAKKRPVEIDWYKWEGDVEELKSWIKLNGDNPDKHVTLRVPKVYNSLEEAIDVWKDDLCEDQVHGEMEFHSFDQYSHIVVTEEGSYELCADIDWNRYDKQFYFIDGPIKVESEKLEDWEEPKQKVEINTLEGSSYDLPLGYIVIKGVQGEYYPCELDIFNRTYDIL